MERFEVMHEVTGKRQTADEHIERNSFMHTQIISGQLHPDGQQYMLSKDGIRTKLPMVSNRMRGYESAHLLTSYYNTNMADNRR